MLELPRLPDIASESAKKEEWDGFLTQTKALQLQRGPFPSQSDPVVVSPQTHTHSHIHAFTHTLTHIYMDVIGELRKRQRATTFVTPADLGSREHGAHDLMAYSCLDLLTCALTLPPGNCAEPSTISWAKRPSEERTFI